MTLKPPPKPRIGVTIGDVAGIGPEIALKAVLDEEIRSLAQLIVIGDETHLRRFARDLGLPFPFHVCRTSDFSLPTDPPDQPRLWSLDNLGAPFRHGEVSPTCGKAAGEYIESAVRLFEAGAIDALATCPINKRALLLGGYSFTGHTELLAHLTGANRFALGFVSDVLRVILLTNHLPLGRALTYIKKDRIERMLHLTHAELIRWGIPTPRLAVAAVNPHGAEGGLFGLEEAAEMLPAIESCLKTNPSMRIEGPIPAETVFLRAFRGEFDAVLCAYHDQGMIPIRCLSFGEAVNVTIGLPFIRTSTSHGTAYDIAGQGIASPSSLIAAIKLAADLVRRGTDRLGDLVGI